MTTQFLRLDINLPRLYSIVERHQIHSNVHDMGYALHAGLSALFADRRPRLFAIEKIGSHSVSVLAYSEFTMPELREHAEMFADPEAYNLCDWDRVAGKPLPSTWKMNQPLGFQVRVCPIIRSAREGGRGTMDMDAFQVASEKAPNTLLSRESVYHDWLKTEAEKGQEVVIEQSNLVQFQMANLLRRTQGEKREARVIRKPEAVLRGTMVIKNPDKFEAFLNRGIGHHLTFGFGMMLLRPPGAR